MVDTLIQMLLGSLVVLGIAVVWAIIIAVVVGVFRTIRPVLPRMPAPPAPPRAGPPDHRPPTA